MPDNTSIRGAGVKERIEVIMTTRKTSALAAIASTLLIAGVSTALATAASADNASPAAQTPEAEDVREAEAAGAPSDETAAAVDLARYDIPDTTYTYPDETWTAIVELWEYIQDESVSVADLRDAMAAKGLTRQDNPELFDTIGGDLRLSAARYENDLAAFACNVLGSALTDSMSFQLEEGVAGLRYQVTPSLNSDPSLVSALAYHKTLSNAFEQLGTLFDDDELVYLKDVYDQPTIMGYVLDDVVENLLRSDFPGVDLAVYGRYTFRPAGSGQALAESGSLSATVENARALDFAWPVNENGQTYGSSSDIAAYLPDGGGTSDVVLSLLPDLVEMVGNSDMIGYVLKEDLYDFSEDGPRARAVLAALEAGEDSFEYTIPVYARDGMTVVDELSMDGAFSTIVQEEKNGSGTAPGAETNTDE